MGDPIRVAIIGTGFGKRVQLPGFLNVDDFEVIGIAGHSFVKTNQIAKELDLKKAYKSWKDVVSDPEVDLISIVTPVFYHYEMAMSAISAGKDVLCEKPMAMNQDEAYQMWEYLEAEGQVGMINHEFRHLPERRYFHHLVNSGRLGEIYEVKVTFSNSSRLPYTGRLWNWWSSELMGGGIWGALGSHLIDFVRWVFGEFEGIMGRLITRVRTRPDPISAMARPVTSDDTYHAIFKLENGVEGMMDGSVVRHGLGGTVIEAHGEKGSLVIKSDRSIWTAENDSEWTRLDIPEEFQLREHDESESFLQPAFESLLKDLSKGIRERKSPTPSFEDGYYVQRVLDALHTSHETQAWVNL